MQRSYSTTIAEYFQACYTEVSWNEMKKKKIKIIKEIIKDNPVEFAYLFGSQLSGELREESDLDLAIFIDSKISSDPLTTPHQSQRKSHRPAEFV